MLPHHTLIMPTTIIIMLEKHKTAEEALPTIAAFKEEQLLEKL